MKKLLSLLLTVSMLFSISTAVVGADVQQKNYMQKYWDVPKDHWAFNYIAELTEKGVIDGHDDGSFRPDDTVTRAEWAKIMVLAAGLQINTDSDYIFEKCYHTDIGMQSWYAPYFVAAKPYMNYYIHVEDNDIIDYKPNQAASREDVTVSMVKLKGYDVSNVDYTYLSQFTDTNSISNSLKAYVAVAVEKDLISGFDDGTFRGQNTLTRAEAATLLWRAFQYGNDNKVVDIPDTPIKTPNTSVTVTEKPQYTEKHDTAPKPTEKPNVTPSIEVETPEPTEKPYIIDTIVKADVNDVYHYTSDNNDNFYYAENNRIYKVNINSRESEQILDTMELSIDNEEMTLDGFNIDSICYDNKRDGLLVTGTYETVNSASIVNNYYLYAVYDDNVELISDYFGIRSGGESTSNVLAFVLDNGFYVNRNGDFGDGNPNDSNGFINASSGIIYENDNGVYSLDYTAGGYINFMKYDYTENIKLWDFWWGENRKAEYSGVITKDRIIMANEDSDLVTYNYSGKEIGIITLKDYKIGDKMPFNFRNVYMKLIATSNDSIIFYDTSAKAFRIISENI